MSVKDGKGLSKEPYGSYYYWENCIRERDVDDMITGSISGTTITKDTVFVYIGIEDENKNIFKSGWSSHKNIKALLGFLEYVFFPMAYLTWMEEGLSGLYIPMMSYGDLRESLYAKKTSKEPVEPVHEFLVERFLPIKERSSLLMDCSWDRLLHAEDYDFALTRLVDELRGIQDEEVAQQQRYSKQLARDFSYIFDGENRKMHLQMFTSSKEIYRFVKKQDGHVFESVFDDMFSINELEVMCQKVYDEAFINRQFIAVLNERLPVWI